MALKRDSNCPLCGARMSPEELLDGCSDLVDLRLGVLEGRCPHCQGHLEIMPGTGRLDIGYRVGNSMEKFAAAVSIAFPGLEIRRTEDMSMMLLVAAGREWSFSEA